MQLGGHSLPGGETPGESLEDEDREGAHRALGHANRSTAVGGRFLTDLFGVGRGG